MLNFLLNIIETPAIILGLVALIGLLLQKKSAGQVFSGTIKTALGMLVLSAGSGLIATEILPFVDLFSKVFHLQGFATSSEAVVGAMQSAVPIIASSSAIVMAAGFLINVIIARFSPLKYIFLTGHVWEACLEINRKVQRILNCRNRWNFLKIHPCLFSS